MKELIYKSVKITIGVILAIVIADVLNLKFTTTAGVITMLSILDTRKQTLTIGIKRIVIGSISVLISGLIFEAVGHDLLALTLFLLILIPTLILIRSTESLTISTVLVTHIYTIQDVTPGVMLNEVFIVLIGVVVAWGLNIHMINVEEDIKASQKKSEKIIKETLDMLAYQLINQCDMCEQEDLLSSLDDELTKGMDLAIAHNNNHLTKNIDYYIRYFQMRRQQYLLLTNTQKYFETSFVSKEMAKPLYEFTKQLSSELNELNIGDDLLSRANGLLSFYREQELPKTREEFEHRAVLFLYLNDMIHFVEIKMKFMSRYGEIKYYGE